jgi:nucleotide-binding universal stress UspA family protein
MVPEIKKILYTTDLTKNSSYAFIYAADLARRRNAVIVMLHVVEPASQAFYTRSVLESTGKAKEQEQEAGLKELEKRLRDFCEKMESQVGFSCVELISKILVPQGYPVEEILKAAEEEDCDVLVLGTHGKGFLKQTFLGSTAASVLQRTQKPVFVIPLPSDSTTLDWNKV